MAYHTSNAAFAYDVQPDSAGAARGHASAPQVYERPQLGVVTGGAREANQETSPAFRHCIKLFCLLAAIFVATGFLRVGIANLTATTLNANAALVNTLEEAQDESSDLEVMYSVYGSSSRIRDLAESYGMVEAEGTVVLDFTEYAADAEAQADETESSTDDASSTETSSDADAQ